MISKLRHKIFVGILLLAILLAASGSMILYQFLVLNRSVKSLIDDNYKTIQACQQMLESLEMEDRGILLLTLGKWEEGRRMINKADSTFNVHLAVASAAETEPDEDRLVSNIRENYTELKDKWRRPIVGTQKERNLEWYSREISTGIREAKESVYILMSLNQQSMYKEASTLKNRSYRAITPGIAAVIAVIVFAFLFNFFLSRSLVEPLQRLIGATRNFRPNLPNFTSNLKTNDEFKELERGIQEVIDRLNRFHEKS